MKSKRRSNNKNKIAVVGVACRFPGADNRNEYWKNISEGIDSVTEIDEDRWNIDEFYSADSEEPNKSVSKWSGLVNDFRFFDAHFFNISPKEAQSMDPQQRILLEEVYHCIEDSGISLEELRAKKTDVYTGVINTGYDTFAMLPETEITSYANSGIFDCITANRISYYFGFTGNSVAMNTGCSASLVAVHHAIEALRSGKCDYAIVAGVNVSTMLVKFISGSKAHLLSPTGSCKTFDKDADGYVPGEGAGAVLLQRFDDAVSENNNISAILRGSSVNHVGTSNSLNSPSVSSQKELISAAISDAEINPEQIGYIETHGTGTSLGDPIEVEALKQTFEMHTKKENFCHIGSVKANIGHLEAASGMASLIKVIMMIKHHKIPPQIHFNVLNPVIQLDNSPFEISKDIITWNPNKGYRTLMAGVSSFGFGGSNAHVIVEEYEEAYEKKSRKNNINGLPFIISAKSQDSLKKLKNLWSESLGKISSKYDIFDVCNTLIQGREHYKYRFCAHIKDWKDISDILKNDNAQEPELKVNNNLALCINALSENELKNAELLIKEFDFASDIFNSVCNQVKEIVNKAYQNSSDTVKAEIRRFCVEYSFAEILLKSGVCPDLVVSAQESIATALCVVGSIDIKNAVDYICSEEKSLGDSIRRPKIPYYNYSTMKVLNTYVVSDEFFNSVLEYEIPDKYIEMYWQRAEKLYGKQFTFTKIIQRWIDSFEKHCNKKISFTQNMLNKLDKSEKKIWFIAIVSSIMQINKKWALSSEQLDIDESLKDMLSMVVNDVIKPDECTSFLTGADGACGIVRAAISSKITCYNDEYVCLNNSFVDSDELEELCSKNGDESSIELNKCMLLGFSGAEALSTDDSVCFDNFGSFEEILETLFLRGVNINWKSIYTDIDFNKCSLVNYPFVHDKKYWISSCGISKNYSKIDEDAAGKGINDTSSQQSDSAEILNQTEASEFNCVCGFFNNELSAILGNNEPIRLDDSFNELGVDSIAINSFNQSLRNKVGDVSEIFLYKTRTLRELTEMFLNEYPDYSEKMVSIYKSEKKPVIRYDSAEKSKVPEYVSEQCSAAVCDEIAIIGMSGQFSDCDNLDEFWNGLIMGKNFVTEIPKERWDYRPMFSTDPRDAKNNKIYCKYGSFMKNVDKFDPLFFKIMPNEAERMDPQERRFLQTAWHTFEDAGYGNLKEIDRSKIGVFVGVTTTTYAMIGEQERMKGNYVYPNSRQWSVANRVSYVLDLKGTSIAVDTACASSMTSFHMACSSILSGESSMAIAGGVNMYLHSSRYVELCQLHMLSSTGRCHTFDAQADGFLPGEGCGAVLLKPLKDAERDHDHIYAVIKSTAINHTGLTGGYAVPSAQSQSEVIQSALKKANVSARTISAVEAHGTGTKLGDPLEVIGLTNAFKNDTSDKKYCSISSVKSNIGHCEGAAGIASVIKAVLELKNKKLVPIYGLNEVNHEINFDDTPFFPQRKLQDWERMSISANDGTEEIVPRRIEISCMGAGGVNVATVLEEYEAHNIADVQHVQLNTLILSANSHKGLVRYAERVLEYVRENRAEDLQRLLYTFQIGRKNMPFRLAVVVRTRDDIVRKLEEFISTQVENETNDIYYHRVSKSDMSDLSVSAEQTAKRLLVQKDIKALAKLWCSGWDNIGWSKLYDDDISKASAPVYPFDEERYWVNISEDIVVEAVNVNNTVPQNEQVSNKASAEAVDDEIIGIISSLSGISVDKIDVYSNFTDYGFDSIVLNDFTDALNIRYNIKVSPTIFFTYNQIRVFIDYLLKEYPSVMDSVNAEYVSETTVSSVNKKDEFLGRAEVMEIVLDAISGISKVSKEQIDIMSNISDYGFDSITLSDLADSLSLKLNCSISPSSFFNKDVISDYIDYLIEEYKPVGTEKKIDAVPAADVVQRTENLVELRYEEKRFEKIAVVGISALLPEADNVDEYWDNLINNVNCSSRVKAERWIGALPEDKILVGGFVKDAFSFDTKFFHISPYEAEKMDPQQRKIIENVWHAIEDSGHSIDDYSGKKTGVFVSTENCDYRDRIREYGTFDELTATGSAANMLANRISYLFDFNGPSEVIDTACSGSLSAINRAVDSIWLGECDSAIVGGTRLILSPCGYTVCEKMGILSSTGKCCTFDESANGYVKGEGVGALVLKPLSKAEEDGDYIYGLIVGKAVNHGGKARSVTAPNAVAQSFLVYDAIKNSGLPLERISYIETHGTATKLGDSIETEGLIKAFSKLASEQGISDSSKLSCGIGSVKPNIGHLENMSGIASVIKILLAMKNKMIPATINFKKLNPLLDLSSTPFHVVDKNTKWTERIINSSKQPLCAGVSSFGFGGSNVHLILEGYDNVSGNFHNNNYVFVLSSKSKTQLREYATNMVKYLKKYTEGKKVVVSETRSGMSDITVQALEELKYLISSVIGIDAQDIDSDASFESIGVVDYFISILCDKINLFYDISICENDILESGTISRLSSTLFSNYYDKMSKHFAGIKIEKSTVQSNATETDSGLNFADFIYTAQVGRTEFDERLAVVTNSFSDLYRKLNMYLENNSDTSIYTGTCDNKNRAELTDGETQKMYSTSPGLLASIWCSGTSVPWKAVYGSSIMKRVSIPGYPFSKERYILDSSRSKTSDETITGISVLHPYVDRNISTLGNTAFAKRFSVNDDVVLQHIIGGRCILPGAAHLSMAYAALDFAVTEDILGLENVSWLNPIYVSSEYDVNINISRKADKITYQIFSDSGSEKLLHSKGNLLTSNADVNYDSVNTLLNCTNTVDVHRIYDEFSKAGIKYGDKFRVIKEAFVSADKKEGYARLNGGSIDVSSVPNCIDAMLLDGIFQSTAILTEEGIKNSFVPFAIGKIQIIKAIPNECIVLVHSKNDFGGQSFTFDIIVIDSELNEVLKISDYCTRMI